MKHEFSFHTAYWNPHHGVCRVYPGPEMRKDQQIRFSPLGDDNRGTYDMRLMPLSKADALLVPIPGSRFNVQKMAFEFNTLSAAFITARELGKICMGSSEDASIHDPYWLWEHGRREKELIHQGCYSEASASAISAGAIIKSQIHKPPSHS